MEYTKKPLPKEFKDHNLDLYVTPALAALSDKLFSEPNLESAVVKIYEGEIHDKKYQVQILVTTNGAKFVS